MAGMSYGRASRGSKPRSSRPDHRMEGDVVLADKIVTPRVGAPPPRLPRCGIVAQSCAFDAGGQVADHGLEPDVHYLALIARNRDRNAPAQVARHGARTQPLLHVVEGEVAHIGAPVRLRLDVVEDSLLHRRQIEEEMGSLAHHRRAARSDDSGDRRDRRRRGCAHSGHTGRRGHW